MDTPNKYDQIYGAIAALTPADFDALAGAGKTVLVTGYMADDFVVPEMQNGWRLRLLTAGQERYCRQLIIQPGSPRSKEIWKKGQIQLATEAGLNPIQAEVWAGSRLPRRHELLKQLGVVLADSHLITAYLNYKDGVDYRVWCNTWGIAKDGLSPSNRRYMVDHLRMVLDGEKRYNSPTHKRLLEIREAEKHAVTLSDDMLALINSRVDASNTVNAAAPEAATVAVVEAVAEVAVEARPEVTQGVVYE